MKIPQRLMVGVAVFLNLGFFAHAAERKRPFQYEPLDLAALQDEVKTLKKEHLAQKDLTALSGNVHNVKIVTISPSAADPAPVLERPQGKLKLHRTIEIE